MKYSGDIFKNFFIYEVIFYRVSIDGEWDKG